MPVMVVVATCNLVDAFLPLCKCFCCLGNCCGCLMERLVYLVTCEDEVVDGIYVPFYFGICSNSEHKN